MKKILLIGKLSDILRNLSEKISENYQVQLSSLNLDNVKGMVKITKPDLLVVCTIGADYQEMDIFQWIRDESAPLPVIVISSKDVWEQIESVCRGERYHHFVPPFSGERLLEECRNLLEMDHVFDSMLDKMESFATENASLFTEGKRNLEIRPTVLVIDDSGIVLRSIKTMLQESYTVEIATNGEMGVQKAIDMQPDVILLDYEMPGMDGSATFQTLLQIESTKHIPVIFLTAVSDGKRVKEVIERHPAGYILKPPDKLKLIGAIEKVLRAEE